jgi:hypothetical protein
LVAVAAADLAVLAAAVAAAVELVAAGKF